MPQRPPDDHPALAGLNDGASATARVAFIDRHDDGGATRVERFRLGNGLTVIVWEDHRAPVFAYQTWLKVGSRHEREGKTGIAHLFEHMMFKATKSRPDGEFDAIMEQRGAQTNAATWVDWTYYKEKLPTGNLALVCELEADRLENLVLNDAQLESEREVVKNERLMRVDNDPEGRLAEELYALAFERHSYGWPTIGWMPDIEGLSVADCMAFYDTYYSPNNATVVVVGDVDTAEVLELVQRFYGHLEARAIPAELERVEPVQRAERRKTLALPLAAPKILYAFHATAATDPGQPAVEVLDEILAGGESSRLHRALVVDREIATEVSSWTAAWAQPGLLELGISLQPGRSVAEAEAVVDEVLAGLRREPPSERELLKAVHGIEASALRGDADTGSRARRLGTAEATVGDYRWYWRHQAALRRVRPGDVHAVAQRVLAPENRTVLIGLPQGEQA